MLRAFKSWWLRPSGKIDHRQMAAFGGRFALNAIGDRFDESASPTLLELRGDLCKSFEIPRSAFERHPISIAACALYEMRKRKGVMKAEAERLIVDPTTLLRWLFITARRTPSLPAPP